MEILSVEEVRGRQGEAKMKILMRAASGRKRHERETLEVEGAVRTCVHLRGLSRSDLAGPPPVSLPADVGAPEINIQRWFVDFGGEMLAVY